MLEFIAVAAVLSVLNLGVFQGMIWKYDTFHASKKGSVVEVTDCDESKDCTNQYVK